MEIKDLIWDLEHLRKRQHAKDLILGIENKLCVFSGSVEQIYTSYDIFFPKEESRKVVILPNPYAHHDTFFGISDDAVQATGLFIVGSSETSSTQERKGLGLVLPINRKEKKFRRVPIDIGLKLINDKRSPDRPFLPILMKGDLREFNANTPCLHLHSLDLRKVRMLSNLEIKSLEEVILERLDELRQLKL
jgi:hypothetical protein